MMQAHYLFWIFGSLLVLFILWRRFSPGRLRNFTYAVKVKSRLLKKLTKQGRKDEDLRNCLHGVQIRKLHELDDRQDDKETYCLTVVWKHRRDFCVDIPELLLGFRVFETTLGKDHTSEPCPMPATACLDCGCADKPSDEYARGPMIHPRAPNVPPPDFFDSIPDEDPNSQEAGSLG